MDAKVCDFLREVDENFNNGGVNVGKFNKFTECHSHCPRKNNSKENKCTNNYERINALGSYLFNKIHEFNKTYEQKKGVSQHIEVFMIWLGAKLFKMDSDYKATLEESYKNHLESIMGNVNYWEIISKKLYKNATIRKMDELYSLLDNVCKLITEYNKNPTNPNRKALVNHAVKCRNFYKSIHKSVNGCRPYLYLLDSVKMMYENFRWNQIVNNNNLRGIEKSLLVKRIESLTTFNNENKLFVTLSEILSFNDKACVEAKSNDEKIGKNIESQKSKGIVLSKKNPTENQGRVSGKLPSANPSVPKSAPVKPPERPPAQTAGGKSTQPQPPASSQKKEQSSPTTVQQPVPPALSLPPSKNDPSLLTPQKSEENHKNGTKDSGGTKGSKGGGVNVLGGGISQPVNSEGKSKDDAQKKTDQVGNSSPGPKAGSQSTGMKNQGSGAGGQVKLPGGTGSGTGSGAGSQGGSGSQTKHSGSPAPAPSGASTSQSPGTPQHPASGTPGASATTSKDTQNDVSNPQDSNSNQGVPGGTGGGDSGANGLSDQKKSSGGSSDPALSTPGGSFDWGSSFLRFILNGTDNLNKASQFIQKNQQKVKEATDKINNVYKNTMDNLKDAYDKSSSYFSEFINNVTSQFNQVDSPPKSGGNQPGSSSPSGGGNSLNQLPSPQLPSATDPKNLPSTLPLPNPPPILPPELSKDPLQQKNPPSQSQLNTQQTTQTNLSNQKTVGQFVKSLSSDLILKKPWNIFPTTWNGSGDCKPEIKFMNATLVCCTSEQCSLTGIPVILVLIPIILLIGYKYLSFGSSKKSEKKNMKRVINFHDGNRKTKVIISSNDRSKHLKPVINSVSKKKDPLLNIYKLIRADPMPFINLFFLLIFFVYKRKRDTIE
ncbi:PIR protein CIR protein [Plasmodium vinckei brucechwatti]|uniref:PIR protein CIR protein n=1 Tax=Plasmodium vinckei brucechwatti TaxID=119398 RepID=A0A6V7RXT6_PLAVN|nr:PIR protein CIR protein [Plasmodium vinckei brucechwatti]